MANRNNITLHVIPGSVVEVPADTILVPGHPGHIGQGGVFGSVKEAGEVSGCEALANWHELTDRDAPLGSVLQVSSNLASSKHLSHAFTVCDFSHGAATNFAVVAGAVTETLKKMHQSGLRRINIPMMGTGQMGWLSPRQSARAMMIGIDKFARDCPDARMDITFCMKSKGREAVMQDVIAKPELYSDIDDQQVQDVRGEAVPMAADLALHEGNNPLLEYARATQRRYSVSKRAAR